MTRMNQFRRRIAAVGLMTALAATGCSSTDEGGDAAPETSPAAAGSEVSVVQPGRPGESATPVDPEDVLPEREWNHSDIAFMQMMVPHHAQALEMSRLAATRAEDERVKSLARRIQAAQGPEIIAMGAWLAERDIDVPKASEDADSYDHGKHGHTAMAGMLTHEQMDELKASRGRRFDRLFLQGMIAHHQGAVDMAQTTARDGVDVVVAEITADVAVGQSAEIERMRDLLEQI